MFDRNETVVISAKQVAVELGSEVVILSLDEGRYYRLNAVGAKIWSMVQEPRPIAEICDRLLEIYPDVDPERCRRETVALIERLAAAGLVELTPVAEIRPS